MSKIILQYFDIDGGRGETIRLLLHWAQLEYEDTRVTIDDWEHIAEKTPFNQLPVVKIDGAVITQTNALCRYFAKYAGLYPENNMASLLCDEVMDAIEDATYQLTSTYDLDGFKQRQASDAFVDKTLSRLLAWLEQRLSESSNGYLAGGGLSVADIKTWVFLRAFLSGQVSFVDPDIIPQLAPKVFSHIEAISKHPNILNYYRSRTA